MGRLWCEKRGGPDNRSGPLLGINRSSRSKVSSGELNGLSYFERFEPLIHSEGFSPKEPRF